MSRLGIITGLAVEAGILTASPALRAADRPSVRRSGIGAGRARSTAQSFVDTGIRALMSFGFAAGLDPALRPGSLVLARRVLDTDGGALPTDAAWCEGLMALVGADCRLIVADIAGADRPLADAGAKRALFEGCGAAAADMESHAVAAVAARAGVPFLALRAVADPAWRAVPRAALAGLMADGRTRALPVLGALAARPAELVDVVRLARDSRAAAAALRRVAALGGPLFGLV